MALSGAVSFDGEPVANGEIVFTPISAGGGRHATGQIVDGRFDIPEQFGAKPGKYRVSVKAFRAIPGARSTNPYAPEAVPQEQYIPSKFNDQTALESEVSADQDEYNFDLKSSE